MPTATLTAGEDFVVPGGVFELTVELEGEAGEEISGSSNFNPEPSGDGGRVTGTLSVTPGETLHIRESQGGDYDSISVQAGGNSIDIRRGGTTLSDRIAVAAGAGGGGVSRQTRTYSEGGDGGGNVGDDAGDVGDGGGYGGTQTAGGAGGGGAEDGSFGAGGDGDSDANGGCGGAGWYGGGGGNSYVNSTGPNPAWGGGGGSNYDDGLDTATANERGTSSRTFGEGGLVTIDYTAASVDNLQITDTTATTNNLSWDAPQLPGFVDLERYRVYRDTNAGSDRQDYTEIATVGPGETTHTDTGLNMGTTYHYRVGADLVAPSLDVDTVSATNVESYQAQLNGDLVSLQDAASADVGFEYREVGGTWATTPTQTLSSSQAFSELVTGLSGETDYEARAVGDAEGVGDTGAIVSWTTPKAIPDSAIHRYQLNEGSGETASDNIGSVDLTLNGPSWTSDTKEGSHALSFAGGSDEAVNNGNGPWGFDDNDPISYTVWLKTSSTSMYVMGDESGRKMLTVFSDGSVGWRSWDGSSHTVQSSQSIDDGNWHFVAVTFDGSEATTYVDADEDGSGSVSYNDNHTIEGLSVRDADGRSKFNGIIDDAMVYDEALSASQVIDIYNTY